MSPQRRGSVLWSRLLVSIVTTLLLPLTRYMSAEEAASAPTDIRNGGHGSHVTSKMKNETVEEFTSRIFESYHKLYRPRGSINDTVGSARMSPTRVRINMYIATFSSVNVIEMDYSVDILLRQRWYDYRLRYSGYNETLSLNYMKDRLWIPDLFFRNAKDGHVHTITTPNYLIWLNQSGHILFSQKLSVKLSCPMYLWKFPMDTQHCHLEMGSYGYAKEDLIFDWLSANDSHQNVQINSQMVLNEFDKPHFRTDTCTKSYNTTGAFTCIYVEFILERKFGFYLIYTYLPSILIVIISWVSFFIDFQAVPARISLGLLSILSLITQSAATLQKLPRVSYVKAIDVWLFACLAFVVFSLLEFAIVNVLTRRQEKREFNNRMRNIIREELTQTVPWAIATCMLPGSGPPPTNSRQQTTGSTNNMQQRLETPLLRSTSMTHCLDDDDGVGPAGDEDDDEQQEIWKRNGSYVTNPGHSTVLRPIAAAKRNHQSSNYYHGHPRPPSLVMPGGRSRGGGMTGGGGSSSNVDYASSGGGRLNNRSRSGYLVKAHQVDRFCVFAFPMLFIAFNLLYWIYFLMTHKE